MQSGDAQLGGPHVLVVMYHYVRDSDPLPSSAGEGPFAGISGLTTAEFTSQVDDLCRTLEPIDWPTLYAWKEGRKTLPSRSFLLTFDDGLADHSQSVAPILQERGLRGVFFVPGSVLMTHRMLPAHAIHLLLAEVGERTLIDRLSAYFREEHPESAWGAQVESLPSNEEGVPEIYDYEDPLRARLKNFLTMTLPIDVRNRAIGSLFERFVGSSARWARHWYVGWQDVVRMESDGHTIGGHGFSHEPLNRLPVHEQQVDIDRVGAILRNGLGPDCRPYSYPYGRVGDPSLRFKDAGFVHAFTTESRWVSGRDGVMTVPRVDTIHVAKTLREECACQQTS